jgi:antitoxin (DNA-binding transcriptional repressor) of toxin-antitoxin stability system
MRAVGIRELKTHLSRHLKDVGAGASLAVTERGRIIAVIHPAGGGAAAPEQEWAWSFVAQGKADWSGGKPRGLTGPASPTSKASVSDAVLEDRR